MPMPKEAFPNATWHTPEALISRIKPGDRVTILVSNGVGRNGPEYKEATGKAVICNHLRDPENLTVALNMGGQYGTPGLATVQNIVCVGKNHRCLHATTTGQPNP
jgi:type II secretory pathway component HofQ